MEPYIKILNKYPNMQHKFYGEIDFDEMAKQTGMQYISLAPDTFIFGSGKKIIIHYFSHEIPKSIIIEPLQTIVWNLGVYPPLYQEDNTLLHLGYVPKNLQEIINCFYSDHQKDIQIKFHNTIISAIQKEKLV